MEISNECDISLKRNDSLCRVCLSLNDENKCIFTSDMTIENRSFTRFWEKLQLYGGIEVKQDDGLPSKICKKCISKVRIAHEFRTQCQESDKKLRSSIEEVASKYDKISMERDGDIGEKMIETNESSSDKSITNATKEIPDPLRISQESPMSPAIAKSICPKKLRENNQPVQRQTIVPRRLMIVEKSSVENIRRSWKICTKRTIGPADDESSKCVAQKSENSITNAAREKDDEKSLPRKEELRSKRLVVFGRMTSMENLKNRKELQRRYVRKTISQRKNSEEREISRFDKNRCHTPKRLVRKDLTIFHYKCNKCCRSYESKKSFDEHQYSHDPEKFSCDQCDERFGKLVEFLKHAKTHELKEKLKPASCRICDKSFRKFLTMVRHLNVHKRDNPRAVYAILKNIRDERHRDKSKFNNENNATIEEERVISNDRYDNSSGFDASNVEKFEETLENGNFTNDALNVDSNSTTNDTELSNSSRTDNTTEDTEIPSDNRSAIKLINNWIREELDSENEGKGFPCEICNKSYVTKKSLLKHTSKVHDVFSPCHICPEYCNCPDETSENIKSQKLTKLHRCEDCGKTFDNETRLERHAKIHMRDNKSEDKNFKRFLCHICSKTFRQNNGLMFHMRTHTGYKPHVCKYCGRGFTSNSNCTNHERTHTGDRPFVCHFCSAAFAKSCTLKAHITTHTGEANYHCKTCGKSFRRLKYLKEHRFTHTGEKPYACKICGTAYSHSGSLFVHEKKCKAVQQDNFRATEENYSFGKSVIINEPDYENEGPMLPEQRHRDILPVNTSENKIFVDDEQRINQPNDCVYSSQSIVPSNARNFSIIGQIFHS